MSKVQSSLHVQGKDLFLLDFSLASQSSVPSCLHFIHSSFPPSLPSNQSISWWVTVSEPRGVWQPVCHFITDLHPSSPPPPTLPSSPLPSPLSLHLLICLLSPVELSRLHKLFLLNLFLSSAVFPPLPLTSALPRRCLHLFPAPLYISSISMLVNVVRRPDQSLRLVQFYTKSLSAAKVQWRRKQTRSPDIL